jgi:hypothetical protein
MPSTLPPGSRRKNRIVVFGTGGENNSNHNNSSSPTRMPSSLWHHCRTVRSTTPCGTGRDVAGSRTLPTPILAGATREEDDDESPLSKSSSTTATSTHRSSSVSTPSVFLASATTSGPRIICPFRERQVVHTLPLTPVGLLELIE